MRRLSLFFVTALLFALKTNAQSGYPCPPNIDLESGTNSGWSAFYGGPATSTNPGGVDPTSAAPATESIITTPVSGFAAGRHTITSGGGTDPNGGFPVVSPNGGAFAWKLGDDNSSNGAERLQYTFTVPANAQDYSINFDYAVVYQNPAGHLPFEMPRFTISVLDATTGTSLKDGCYDLNFIAGGGVPGFFTTPAGVEFKPWTKSAINLTGAEGKTIIIDIVVGDCSLGGHWGYGYFDVISCDTFKARIVPGLCNLDEQGITIKAPEGYMTYDVWNQNYTEHLTSADTNLFAFHPTTLTPQRYNVILTPFPSVNSCIDTTKTDPITTFTLTVPDSICALPDQQILLNATAQGGTGALSYLWSESNGGGTLSCTTCTDPTAQTDATNYYQVKVMDELGCYRHDTSTVFINTESGVDAIEDFILCHPGYVDLDVEPIDPAPLTPVTCGISADPPCTNPLSVEVRTLHRDHLFKRDTTSFVNPISTRLSSSHTQFLLKKEDMFFYGLKYGRLTSLALDVYKPGIGGFESMTISLACSNRPSMNGGMSSGMTQVYSSTGSINPVQGWNSFIFDQAYDWDTSQNLIVDICFTNAIVDSPATVIQMINTGSNDMFTEYTTSAGADVCNGSPAEEIKTYNGRPNVRFDYCYSKPADFKYAWFPGVYVSDSSIKAPFAYIPETREIFVKSQGRNGCFVYDSVTVTVPVHDYEIFPKDTSVCLYEPFQLIAGGTFASVQWYEYDQATNTFTIPTSLSCSGCPDPNTIPNPIATPPLDTSMYAVVYTDKDNCTDTLYMNYEIRPLPPVMILNNDTTIKYGQDIMLIATGAFLYTWTPSASLSNPNVVNPIASPLDPTLYYVHGIGENGCKKIDSVMVNIDYGANLFVPTAFTPNGDGKNDVFRVSNVTFQRLQEFKVFNRWGQEIFSTNDIKKGWDGSWKGQPQDMGVYQYIIKLASPEGRIETYKGDVTLVR